jgi:hypothetical protein
MLYKCDVKNNINFKVAVNYSIDSTGKFIKN